MQECYQHEPKHIGFYSRNSLSKIKIGAYIINLNENEAIGTHWIALCLNGNNEPILTVLELNIFQKKFKNS